MVFVKRLGFYLLGFSIGLILLAYFLKGKNTEFCYAPNCRVLKNINTKKIEFSAEIYQFLTQHNADSSQIAFLLKEGDVIFSRSNPQDKPCAVYIIKGTINNVPVEVSVKNCDLVAFVEKIEAQK